MVMGTYGEALHQGNKAQPHPYRSESSLHLQMRILVRKGRLLENCNKLSRYQQTRSLLLERRTLFIYLFFFSLSVVLHLSFRHWVRDGGTMLFALLCCFFSFFPFIRYTYTACAKTLTLLLLFFSILFLLSPSYQDGILVFPS